MKNKIFIYAAGVITGIILTFVVALIITGKGVNDDIEYFKNPVSYEDKSYASFKVMQVKENCALANEGNAIGIYLGKTVLLDSDSMPFYDGQIIEIDNPLQIGIYKYKSNGGLSMTVPVIYVPR